MTISNLDNCVNLHELIDTVHIYFICPVCKTKKELTFPRMIIDQNKNLTTISIPKKIICEHPFQAFIDKNYKIRGYQKVDFEFCGIKDHKERDRNIKERSNSKNKGLEDVVSKKDLLSNQKINSKYLKLKEIYEDFWDFIDNNNKEFQQFIMIDKRR
ncbi:MAG: hypothetical protein KGD63_01175 [Candidatus Lokiarchaeota archaeon]|nr:hypothetical protein [Candidatus Lokiarchaeota archaeon]